MRDNGHQVDRLPKCSVNLIPFYVNQLVDSTETESTDGAELILRRNVKHFIYEVRLPESLIELCKVFNLAVNLPVLFQLVCKVALIIIHFPPDLLFLNLDYIFAFFQVFEHILLCFRLLCNAFKLLVKSALLFFECF